MITIRNPTNGELQAIDADNLDAEEGHESPYSGWEIVCEGYALNVSQAMKLEQVKSTQGERFMEGWSHEFSVGTHVLDIRPNTDDKNNWTLLLIQAQGYVAAGAPTHPMKLHTQSNEDIYVPALEAYQAMQAFLGWGQMMLDRKWVLDAAIRAAPTTEELEAIDVEAGWP